MTDARPARSDQQGRDRAVNRCPEGSSWCQRDCREQSIAIIGYGTGDLILQVHANILPLWTGDWFQSFNNFLLVFGVLTALIYFFFSKEHKGAVGAGAKIGIWFLMISFGASFGYTVMSRMSLLIGRVYFLLEEWLGLIS